MRCKTHTAPLSWDDLRRRIFKLLGIVLWIHLQRLDRQKQYGGAETARVLEKSGTRDRQVPAMTASAIDTARMEDYLFAPQIPCSPTSRFALCNAGILNLPIAFILPTQLLRVIP